MSLLLFGLLAGASPYVQVLGVAQDAGHPQLGCDKTCCTPSHEDGGHHVVSLGIVAPETGKHWLLDASPDLPAQAHSLGGIDGVFLTHAHIGHYTGLMYLGRESMGAVEMPVYAMPRMSVFLRDNGPWSQLVSLHNVSLMPLTPAQPVVLADAVSVEPFLVPHRDEFSETVGFIVRGPNASVLYLPDIDKWSQWDTPVEEWIHKVDRAYLDGTFFGPRELPGRDMSQIPHPFVVESLERFAAYDERGKIHFIHFNHTNPLLADGPETAQVVAAGMHVAREGERFGL